MLFKGTLQRRRCVLISFVTTRKSLVIEGRAPFEDRRAIAVEQLDAFAAEMVRLKVMLSCEWNPRDWALQPPAASPL